jgi:Golgi SNAP receptor complex protein 1
MRGIQSLTSTNPSNTSTSTTNTATTMISNNSSLSSNSANVQRSDWESLRKQARQLENEIDSKLVGFSKLCSNIATASITNRSPSSQQNQSQSAAAQSSADLLFPTLSNEIEDALKKLNLINGKMSDSISIANTNGVAGDTNDYTLQRHRDILRDYSHEYEKTKRNIISYKEREKLLSPAHSSHSNNQSNLNNRGGQSNNNATSLYMKEFDHLKSSHNLIDQQLEIAELTKENLQSQRNNLRMIQQKMNTLAHKFPLINSLVQRVKLKKRKDPIILALVISICLFLMLLYVF